eukprot:1072384-Lingulodinium_polyedra.AAC.1
MRLLEKQRRHVGPESHFLHQVHFAHPSCPFRVDTANMACGPAWNGMSLGKSPRCASRVPGDSA